MTIPNFILVAEQMHHSCAGTCWKQNKNKFMLLMSSMQNLFLLQNWTVFIYHMCARLQWSVRCSENQWSVAKKKTKHSQSSELTCRESVNCCNKKEAFTVQWVDQIALSSVSQIIHSLCALGEQLHARAVISQDTTVSSWIIHDLFLIVPVLCPTLALDRGQCSQSSLGLEVLSLGRQKRAHLLHFLGKRSSKPEW